MLLVLRPCLGIAGIRGSSPGPYCPDTGNAQITWNESAVVALVMVEFISDVAENGGITSFAGEYQHE